MRVMPQKLTDEQRAIVIKAMTDFAEKEKAALVKCLRLKKDELLEQARVHSAMGLYAGGYLAGARAIDEALDPEEVA